MAWAKLSARTFFPKEKWQKSLTMCGIAGFIGIERPSEGRIQAALGSMRNRGPDAQAARLFEADGTHLALLHSRLSIIDLDERSNQPFSIGHCTLAFNGEIYNYVELREALAARGVQFRTNSDTEVLLQSYLAYGETCVDAFEGMWSFALWDGAKKKLLLSRDRFAEKPLYFWRRPEGLYFGSEVKAIAGLCGEWPRPNKRQVLRYLVNGYKSLYKQDETFFEGVYELSYGSNMIVETDLRMEKCRYWVPSFVPGEMSEEEAVEGVRERFIESMKLRLRADVPMAFCLSGGIDSSAIVSTASKIFGYDVASFSIIDRDERYNELENVEATVRDLKCRSTKIQVSKTGTLERLKKLISYHDMPVATISYLVHEMLSGAIAAQGYKVVASGTAADELFTGYYDHYNLHLYEMRNHPLYAERLADWKKHLAPIVRNPHLKNPELYFKDPGFRGHIYLNNDVFAEYMLEPFAEDFFEEKYCGNLLRNRMLNELFHESIPVILHEDDLNSMCHSIENRSPFLDRKLFEFAYSIPSEHLIRDGYNKWPLRAAMKGILNEKVRLDRRKKGFNASINSLLDFEEPETRKFLLAPSPIFELVKRERIEEAMRMNPAPNSFSKFLFNFINAKIFLESRG